MHCCKFGVRKRVCQNFSNYEQNKYQLANVFTAYQQVINYQRELIQHKSVGALNRFIYAEWGTMGGFPQMSDLPQLIEGGIKCFDYLRTSALRYGDMN